jgi:hypothetical protein
MGQVAREVQRLPDLDVAQRSQLILETFAAVRM